MAQTFYDLEAVDLKGNNVKMSDYKGKTVLVVNTASECGLTPQFEGLEKLYQDYKDKGLVILGFPCNQFGAQEPGDKDDIEKVCRINYGVTFPMFSKIEVNGDNTHPIFKFLKDEKGGLFGKMIKWNFTKFLVDKDGEVVKRFAPTDTPEKVGGHLSKLIG